MQQIDKSPDERDVTYIYHLPKCDKPMADAMLNILDRGVMVVTARS